LPVSRGIMAFFYTIIKYEKFKEKKRMKSRNLKALLLIVLVLTIVTVTSLTFAYWDQLSKTQPSGDVNIGEGATLVVAAVATAPADKTLIPSDATIVVGTNDVTSITMTYNVNIDKTSVSDLNLSVALSNLQAGAVTYSGGLVNVNASIDGGAVTDLTLAPLTISTLNSTQDY